MEESHLAFQKFRMLCHIIYGSSILIELSECAAAKVHQQKVSADNLEGRRIKVPLNLKEECSGPFIVWHTSAELSDDIFNIFRNDYPIIIPFGDLPFNKRWKCYLLHRHHASWLLNCLLIQLWNTVPSRSQLLLYLFLHMVRLWRYLQ